MPSIRQLTVDKHRDDGHNAARRRTRPRIANGGCHAANEICHLANGRCRHEGWRQQPKGAKKTINGNQRLTTETRGNQGRGNRGDNPQHSAGMAYWPSCGMWLASKKAPGRRLEAQPAAISACRRHEPPVP